MEPNRDYSSTTSGASEDAQADTGRVPVLVMPSDLTVSLICNRKINGETRRVVERTLILSALGDLIVGPHLHEATAQLHRILGPVGR